MGCEVDADGVVDDGYLSQVSEDGRGIRGYKSLISRE